MAIYRSSGNPLLADFVTDLYAFMLDHRRLAVSQPGAIEKSYRDHVAIYEASAGERSRCGGRGIRASHRQDIRNDFGNTRPQGEGKKNRVAVVRNRRAENAIAILAGRSGAREERTMNRRQSRIRRSRARCGRGLCLQRAGARGQQGNRLFDAGTRFAVLALSLEGDRGRSEEGGLFLYRSRLAQQRAKPSSRTRKTRSREASPASRFHQLTVRPRRAYWRWRRAPRSRSSSPTSARTAANMSRSSSPTIMKARMASAWRSPRR